MGGSLLVNGAIQAVAVCVDGQAVLVLEKLAGVLFDALGYWDVNGRDTKIWVGGWRAMALHSEYPGRGLILSDTKGFSQCPGDPPRLVHVRRNLMLFTLEVHFSMATHGRLSLMLEKRIMKHPVININFPHFRLNSLSHSLFQTFVGVI